MGIWYKKDGELAIDIVFFKLLPNIVFLFGNQ